MQNQALVWGKKLKSVLKRVSILFYLQFILSSTKFKVTPYKAYMFIVKSV